MATSASPPRVDRCRSCGAPIIWTVTERGRNMPVDAAPVADGNIKLHQGTGGGWASQVVKPGLAEGLATLTDGARLSMGLRRSHFQTCPKADEHRKPRTVRR